MEKKTQEKRAPLSLSLSLSLIEHARGGENKTKRRKSRTHIIACIAAFGGAAAVVSTAGVASFISKAFSADWTASATTDDDEETFSSASSSTLPFSFGSTTARIEKEVALLLDDELAQDDDAARATRQDVCCKENIT